MLHGAEFLVQVTGEGRTVAFLLHKAASGLSNGPLSHIGTSGRRRDVTGRPG